MTPGGGSAHGHGGVAAQHGVAGVRHGQRIGEGLEILRGVVVADARQADVFVDDGFFFLAELLGEDALQGLKADARHAEGGADGQGILGDFVAADVGQLGNRQRAQLHSVGRLTGLDGVGIVDTGAAAGQQAQVPVHRVLVEGNQQIDPIAHVGDFVRAGANGEESMAAANDGLVGVVDVEVQPTAAEDFCEDITRGGYALTSGAPDTDSEGLPHRFISRLRGAAGHSSGTAGSYPVKHYSGQL